MEVRDILAELVEFVERADFIPVAIFSAVVLLLVYIHCKKIDWVDSWDCWLAKVCLVIIVEFAVGAPLYVLLSNLIVQK